jgi:hypothetical protein
LLDGGGRVVGEKILSESLSFSKIYYIVLEVQLEQQTIPSKVI